MKVDDNVKTFNLESGVYKQARPTYPQKLFEVINNLSNETVRAWDCACGSGQVAYSLDSYFDEVYATDINENQVLNSYGSETIHYSVQNSEKTTFEDNFFDVVCVAQAMHWFDIDKYFSEVKRVLKLGGLFACFGYSFFKIEPEIDKIIEDEILEPIKPYWSDKNRILWEGYKGIDFPFKKIDIPKIVMKENWNLVQLMEYIKTWSAYKRFRDENQKDIVSEAIEKLKPLWVEQDSKEVVMDFCFYIGRN